MVGMNSKKVNDKQKKKKKKKGEELAKATGASDIVYKPNLKVEEEERKRM